MPARPPLSQPRGQEGQACDVSRRRPRRGRCNRPPGRVPRRRTAGHAPPWLAAGQRHAAGRAQRDREWPQPGLLWRDPETGSLTIAAQYGFGAEFLDYFAVVDDAGTACGRAAANRAQIVIADVGADPCFEPHRDMAAASGFRAVQSTPLLDLAGRLVGVISTHYPRPYQPSGRDLMILKRYGELVGETMATRL
jgi:GAF domain-containing protein